MEIALDQIKHCEPVISPRPATGETRVDIIESLDGFLALAEPWSRLAASCGRSSVFQTHEWLRCWWESFGAAGEIVGPCVWQDGQLVAAAVMRVGRNWFRGMPVRKLTFMSNSITGMADVLVRPDCPQAREALMRSLFTGQRRWDMMELSKIPIESPTWGMLTGQDRNLPWRSVAHSGSESPVIAIDRTWEEFLDGRSKSFRKIIRRRIAGIEKCDQRVQARCLSDRGAIMSLLPEVFAISSRSWKARVGRSLTDNPPTVDFYHRLTDVLGGRGWVRLWLLKVGSTNVAFEYHLCRNGSICPIRADFDERFARLSPGAHLEYEILRNLFEDPARAAVEYDTCADNYAYERKWTDVVRSYGMVRIFPSGLYGRLLHGLGRLHRRQQQSREPIASVRQTV